MTPERGAVDLGETRSLATAGDGHEVSKVLISGSIPSFVGRSGTDQNPPDAWGHGDGESPVAINYSLRAERRRIQAEVR